MEEESSKEVQHDRKEEDPNVISEGDQVVFHREGWSRVLQVRKKRQIYLDKMKLDVDGLIGQPYGSTFEADRGKLVKVDISDVAQVSIGGTSSESGTDNRNLLDLDSNQRMSKEDIMKMKDEGVTGQKIIEELIENSETFKSKTEFSKAKYLKKKKKKHISVFTVLRPTPRLVLEIYSKEPAKIGHLRADSLSQLLSYSNAMYGSCVGVVETCQGLVLSSLLQRVGDAGKVIQLIPNSTNSVCRQVMDYLGFSKSEENMYTFPMDELNSLQSGDSPFESDIDCKAETAPIDADTSERISGGEEAAGDSVNGDGQKPDGDSAKIAESKESIEADESGMRGTAANSGEKRQLGPLREAQRHKRANRQKEAGQIIKEKRLDSLVLACKYNPTPIVMKMLQFLRPSVSVAIHCLQLEPLVECYTQVKENHAGLQLKLSETWLRHYQILPQRTHPHINMSGTGGYLLTFITCHRTSFDS